MWPTLFSFDIIKLPTAGVVLLVGFLASGFTFWRRGKEEHYSEIQLFDGFILSFLAGAVAARLGFILLHFSQFGWNLFSWFDLANNPGSQDLFLLLGSTLFLYRFAKRKKWDAYEVLDFWALALALWLFFNSLADFFAGSGRGRFTNWVVGVVFPGSIEKTHPVQLYFAFLYLLLYLYLVWAESRYRIFDWYRMGRKSAQTGFLISTFMIFFSFFSALMLLFRLPEFMIGRFSVDIWLYLTGVLLGMQLLLRRSDKPLLPSAFKKRFERSHEEILP
jgi:prolipoprotein diacylglyceryltransferase